MGKNKKISRNAFHSLLIGYAEWSSADSFEVSSNEKGYPIKQWNRHISCTSVAVWITIIIGHMSPLDAWLSIHVFLSFFSIGPWWRTLNQSVNNSCGPFAIVFNKIYLNHHWRREKKEEFEHSFFFALFTITHQSKTLVSSLYLLSWGKHHEFSSVYSIHHHHHHHYRTLTCHRWSSFHRFDYVH